MVNNNVHTAIMSEQKIPIYVNQAVVAEGSRASNTRSMLKVPSSNTATDEQKNTVYV